MNIKEIKELIEIVAENGAEKVEINDGDFNIKIKMPTAKNGSSCQSYQSENISEELKKDNICNITRQIIEPSNEMSEMSEMTEMNGNVKLNDKTFDFNDLYEIKSPMVGVYYSSASPDSDAFIKIGQKVKKGDVLCIIEAMKLMNEICAEKDGEIVDICVENGQVVEFSQLLFKIF